MHLIGDFSGLQSGVSELFSQLAAHLSSLQDVSATFRISTRKEFRPAPALATHSLGSRLLWLAAVELEVLIPLLLALVGFMSDAGVMRVSILGACVSVCVSVQCPGLCLCLTNPSYTCCSSAGLSQPTAHWIVS